MAHAVLWLGKDSAAAFSVLQTTTTHRGGHKRRTISTTHVRPSFISASVSEETEIISEQEFKGFGTQKKPSMSSRLSHNEEPSSSAPEKDENQSVLSIDEAKAELLELLPSLTGKAHEYRRVETLVNTLESLYQPVQTLDFLNLLQQGDWQLLFSTNMVNNPQKGIVSPQVFRMRELFHTMECANLGGNLTTHVVWDLADGVPGQFDCTGSFTVKSSYEIQHGARLSLALEEHILQPRGQRMPNDCQALVGLLFRAMPSQVFDPSDHSADTTYVDGNLKILRYTGPQHEGVRDIWIRRGALEINPTTSNT